MSFHCIFFLIIRTVWKCESQPSILFYICSSVHRNSRLKKSNKMQLYADIYLLLNYSTYFGCTSHQSSGVHKTVVAAFSTDNTIWGASFFKRDQVSSRLRKLVLVHDLTCSRLRISLLPRLICTRGCNYSFMYS